MHRGNRTKQMALVSTRSQLPEEVEVTHCLPPGLIPSSVMSVVRLVWFVNKTHTSVSGDSVPLWLPISSMHPWF